MKELSPEIKRQIRYDIGHTAYEKLLGVLYGYCGGHPGNPEEENYAAKQYLKIMAEMSRVRRVYQDQYKDYYVDINVQDLFFTALAAALIGDDEEKHISYECDLQVNGYNLQQIAIAAKLAEAHSIISMFDDDDELSVYMVDGSVHRNPAPKPLKKKPSPPKDSNG